MWIVELALRRPYTFVVMAIAIAMFGLLSIFRMNVDIFPFVNLPVVSCIYTYTGMSVWDLENLCTTVVERALTSTVNGIQRMESTTLGSMLIIKVYLQKGTDIGQSVAMVTSVGTAVLKQLPPGIAPPFVTSSHATDVPVVQLVLQSDKLSEAKLFDLANNLVRSQLATVPGSIIPFPYGGKFRQVMIDVDPAKLNLYGLSAQDIVTAVKNQNVIDPSGTAKMGKIEYICVLNNEASTIAGLNNLPVKADKTLVVFLKDVAQVHDGAQPQCNIVNLNGKHVVMLNIIKNGDASTLRVVSGVKKMLPRIRSLVPPECEIKVITDRSIFVQDCVMEVVQEACTAAGLTALMMLALLGSWRSTLIVAISIPLAILAAVIGLSVTGQTINSMTLGGLALAVGMLVDDATVEVENIHRNSAMGKNIETAIMDGASQVALPALVSTMSICIVFVPVFLLTEPSKSLFSPLGLAVALAMMASYGLSRTVVPVMAMYLFKGQPHGGSPAAESSSTKGNIFVQIHESIEYVFEAARNKHRQALTWVLNNATVSICIFFGLYALSFCLLPFLGSDYFPTIDGGVVRLHVNAHSGTRIEETEKIFRRVEAAIRREFPGGQVEQIVDNIGLPVHGINYAYSDSRTLSSADGEILVTLAEKRPHDTAYYERAIRRLMKDKFPECVSFFQPGDIVTQILDAGLPAPIDVKILGQDRATNFKIATELRHKVANVPGTADVMIAQMIDGPHIEWTVDRTRAREVGLTQKDISNSFLISLSSSFQTQPNFWLNGQNGTNYYMAAQTPQRCANSIDAIGAMPITGKISLISQERKPQELLTNLAKPVRGIYPVAATHVNVQPCYEVCAACDGRDLGGVSKDINKILEDMKNQLPRSTFVRSVGQALSMKAAFIALVGGLGFALLLVYLLLVVNFQSWTDPLIILMAVPGALAGIVWALYATQTPLSIPALMGAIMTVGVASANSILMVTFANEQLSEGVEAKEAALNAGFERFRPVIMTATAMIIGMIPMAIGAGQGGSQNAPIGRAVIGGLSFATFSTLLLVPLVFSLTRKKKVAAVTKQKERFLQNVDR
ncbi:MAG TPA: efflux RND transporter permease subunit [Oculatellaceae cyanobacterium]